jgi:peptidoglycan/LPS O-acetylase OafA/YrhL
MKLPETAFKLAFFGMKHEAEDIIDYIAINFSVLISILGGAIAAVWIGHVVNMPVGVIAGIGFYGLSMILCYFALLHGHRD